MTTRHADVIAAIAAAVDDWEHAGDAFRYAAPWDEPVVRDPRGPVEVAMSHGMDGYAAHALYRYELCKAVEPLVRHYLPRWLNLDALAESWPDGEARVPHDWHTAVEVRAFGEAAPTHIRSACRHAATVHVDAGVEMVAVLCGACDAQLTRLRADNRPGLVTNVWQP